jgi:hypothetical protein
MPRWMTAVLAKLPCPETEDGDHEWAHETVRAGETETWRVRCVACGRTSPGIDRTVTRDERMPDAPKE